MTNKHITKPEKNDYLQGKKIIDVKCGGYHSIIISVHSEVKYEVILGLHIWAK